MWGQTVKRCTKALHDAAPPAIRLYGLRHANTTMLLTEREPCKTVSERLDHASIMVALTVCHHVTHALMGGGTESGKSGGMNVVMGNLSACDVVVWAIDLKRGIELGPWAPCVDRLAVTPAQARALLHDAVLILEARAAEMATEGRWTWEPSPDRPALVIIVDEYAELADDAPEAMADAQNRMFCDA